MIKSPLVAIVFVSLVGCSFFRGKGSQDLPASKRAESANAFHERYYTIEEASPGRLRCVPKGALATVLSEQHCEHGLEGCKVGLDAAAGRLDSDIENLFADTLERTDTAFAYECVGLARPASGPENLHLLGLTGLGLLASSNHTERLLALDNPSQRDAAWHVTMRPTLAYALWQSGDRDSALPKLVELAQLPGTDDRERARIVLYVGRWDSADLVDTCVKQVTEPTSDELAHACAWYLGRQKTAAAIPLLGNAKLGAAGIRALSLAADAKAVEAVTRAMNPATASDNARIAARVALLNLGKKEALRDFVAALGGNAGTRKASNETPKLTPDEVSREAALETLALANRAYDKDVIKALKKTVASKNEQTVIAAWIALAYLGDEQAIETLAQTIAGADDGLRLFILENVGSRRDSPGRHYATGGYGVLGDARLSAAIADTFATAEPNVAGRTEAVTALANMKRAK